MSPETMAAANTARATMAAAYGIQGDGARRRKRSLAQTVSMSESEVSPLQRFVQILFEISVTI